MRAMVSRIPISEASGHLDDLVERVRAGEEFVIEKAGKDVLRIGPADARRMLGRDLVELLDRLPAPDDEYFDEVERVARNQGEPPANEWE